MNDPFDEIENYIHSHNKTVGDRANATIALRTLRAKLQAAEARVTILVQKMAEYESGKLGTENVMLRGHITFLSAEVARLNECLKTANSNHEHFEREWYLSGDRIAALEARIEKLREGILEARHEGCGCDFHLYGMDADLDTDEQLDRFDSLTVERNKAVVRAAALELGITEHREVVCYTLHAGEDIDRRLWSLLGGEGKPTPTKFALYDGVDNE